MTQRILQTAESEICALITNSNPPTNLLPICQVFPNIAYNDERTGCILMHFKLSCEKKILIPDSVNLEIKTVQRKVFTDMVKLYGLKSPEHPESNMRRTETIRLSVKDYPEIWNNPDVEITFSHGGKISSFLIYI